MAKIETISGVIVFDVNGGSYRMIDYLNEMDFKDGLYKSDYSAFVFVATHAIEISIPDDFDIIKPQLAGLDHQEKELKAKYHAALTKIQVKRNNLLAIESCVW